MLAVRNVTSDFYCIPRNQERCVMHLMHQTNFKNFYLGDYIPLEVRLGSNFLSDSITCP